MLSLLRKISPKFLDDLDRKLLLNYPLLWAGRFIYIVFVCLVVLVIYLVLSSIQPISYTKATLSASWLRYFCILTWIVVFGVWTNYQRMYDYRLQHGSNTKHYELKIVCFSYLVILLIAAATFVPYFNWESRIRAKAIDDSLPEPSTSDYEYYTVIDKGFLVHSKDQYSDAILNDAHLKDFQDPVLRRKREMLNQVKRMKDHIEAYVVNQKGVLSDSELAWLLAYRSFYDQGLKLTKIDTDRGLMWIERRPQRDKQAIKGLISYEDFDETTHHSSLYGIDVVHRTLPLRYPGQDNANTTFLSTYYYRSMIDSSQYVYARPSVVQASLLAQKIREELRREKVSLGADEEDKFIKSKMQAFLDNEYSAAYIIITLFVVSFVSVFANLFIRFFGVKLFFVSAGFASPMVFFGLYLYLATLDLDLYEIKHAFALLGMLLLVFFALWRLGKGKFITPRHIVLLQVITYVTSLLLLFVYLLSNQLYIRRYNALLADLMYLLFAVACGLAFPSFIIHKCYRVYAMPGVK